MKYRKCLRAVAFVRGKVFALSRENSFTFRPPEEIGRFLVRQSIGARDHARLKQTDESCGGGGGDDNDADNPSAAHSLIGEKICRRRHRRRAVTQFY